MAKRPTRRSLLARGQALLASGDVPSALIELKNAVQGAPENPQARFILGNAYLSTGNAAAALKELTRARSLGMNSDELNLAVTKAMIVSGKMSEAATELALNSNQSSAAWVTLQGLLDLAVGRFEEASVELAKAIDLDPNNVDARRGAVRAAIGLGNTDQARVFVEEALAISTDDFAIWLLKGNLERHDQRFAEALEAYSKGLEIVPGSPIALLQRAAVHVASLHTDAALADLDAHR